MFDRIRLGFDDRDFLLNIFIFILQFHDFAGRLDGRNRCLDIMGQLRDQFLLTAVGAVFTFGRGFQFFTHPVERFGKSTEVVMSRHLKGQIEIPLTDLGSKCIESPEWTDVEIPDQGKQQQSHQICRRTAYDQLQPLFLHHGLVFLPAGIKRDLSLDRAIHTVVKGRPSGTDQFVIDRFIIVIREQGDLTSVFLFERRPDRFIGRSGGRQFLRDLIGLRIQFQHVDRELGLRIDP